MDARMERLESLIKAQAAMLESQSQRLEAQAAEIKALKQVDEEVQTERDEENVLCPDYYDNIYCFAMHELIWPVSVGTTVQSGVMLCWLLFGQIILAFAFFDAAWLGVFLNQLPAFTDNIQMTNFYGAEARLGNEDDQIQTMIAAIMVSLLILGILIRRDNISTLVAGHPIDMVFDQDLGRCLRDQPLLLLWRIFAALSLQFCWALRALALPVYAGCGGAIALANCTRADEIVLNSLAIAFVFELDELFYTLIMSPRRRMYEKSPSLPRPLPAATRSAISEDSDDERQKPIGWFQLPDSKWAHSFSERLTPATPVVQLYSLLMYVLDVVIMFTCFAYPAGLPTMGIPFTIGIGYPIDELNTQLNPANDIFFRLYGELTTWLRFARSTVFSLFYAQLAIRDYIKSDNRHPRRAAKTFVRIILIAGVNLLFTHFMEALHYTEFYGYMNLWQPGFVDQSELADCVMQVNRNASCVNKPFMKRGDPRDEAAGRDWRSGAPYPPWGVAVNTPGWTADPESPTFYGIPGIGEATRYYFGSYDA